MNIQWQTWYQQTKKLDSMAYITKLIQDQWKKIINPNFTNLYK